MYCTNCNKQIATGSKFCMYCGTKVEEKIRCSKCGEIIPKDGLFCPACGNRVNNSATGVERLQPKQIKTVNKYEIEFYNTNHCSNVSLYNNQLYIIHNGQVFKCKKEEKARKIELIKDDASFNELYVNSYGIFIYKKHVDRGTICKLYNHDGIEQGSFSISRRGKKH